MLHAITRARARCFRLVGAFSAPRVALFGAVLRARCVLHNIVRCIFLLFAGFPVAMGEFFGRWGQRVLG